jgi:cytoskeletal protein CcmA (bactofilin family)
MSNVVGFFKKESVQMPAVVATQPAVPTKVLEISSIIGVGMEFTGDTELTSGMRINGLYSGAIWKKACESNEVVVHIAAGGALIGDVTADIVIIDGEVVGTVTALKNLVVRGLIRGRATYGDSVELSGIIEADIRRMGHTEFKDVTAALAPVLAPALSPAQRAVLASKGPLNTAQSQSDQPASRPRAPRAAKRPESAPEKPKSDAKKA